MLLGAKQGEKCFWRRLLNSIDILPVLIVLSLTATHLIAAGFATRRPFVKCDASLKRTNSTARLCDAFSVALNRRWHGGFF